MGIPNNPFTHTVTTLHTQIPYLWPVLSALVTRVIIDNRSTSNPDPLAAPTP